MVDETRRSAGPASGDAGSHGSHRKPRPAECTVPGGRSARGRCESLLSEYDRLADELTNLIVRINTTNLATEVEPGLSMTAALALRDGFRMRHRVRTDLADAASQTQDRFTRTELRYVPAVDVRALRQEADDFAQKAREVDILIQEVNWTTEIDLS